MTQHFSNRALDAIAVDLAIANVERCIAMAFYKREANNAARRIMNCMQYARVCRAGGDAESANAWEDWAAVHDLQHTAHLAFLAEIEGGAL